MLCLQGIPSKSQVFNASGITVVEDFKRRLRHEGTSFVNGIKDLIRKGFTLSLAHLPFYHSKT
jgi:hypothetical protein